MTREQAVLEKLIEGQSGKYFYFYNHRVPVQFVPLKEIVNENCGGSEGTRRLRTLRGDKNLDIEMRDFSVEITEDGKTIRKRTFLYRLNTPAHRIDRQKCRLLPLPAGFRKEQNGQLSFA